MDDDDYLALIEDMTLMLREMGADAIADERHYLHTDPETGDVRLIDPEVRLLQMLKAFERFLAIQDRALHDEALARIGRSLDGRKPERAVVLLPGDDVHESRAIDLSEAPRLGRVREELRAFIGELAETGRDTPRGRAR